MDEKVMRIESARESEDGKSPSIAILVWSRMNGTQSKYRSYTLDVLNLMIQKDMRIHIQRNTVQVPCSPLDKTKTMKIQSMTCSHPIFIPVKCLCCCETWTVKDSLLGLGGKVQAKPSAPLSFFVEEHSGLMHRRSVFCSLQVCPLR